MAEQPVAETVRPLFTAETIAERQDDASLLDSVIALYRQDGDQWELVARNDDYYSDDSYVEMLLAPGTYYVGVSAAGNDDDWQTVLQAMAAKTLLTEPLITHRVSLESAFGALQMMQSQKEFYAKVLVCPGEPPEVKTPG